jgi:hypothetical protein
MDGSTMDTTTLLTMLGIVAAVWAVVPATVRLGFRLSFSWWDLWLILLVVVVIHILVFENVFRTLDIYPSLGPWNWGFDKNGVLYLLFLGLALFIYARTQRTKLSHRNLRLFERLAIALLHARKFEELGQLLDQHLETVFAIANENGLRGRLQSWLAPSVKLGPKFQISPDGKFVPQPEEPWVPWTAWLNELRQILAESIGPSVERTQSAKRIIRSLLSSRELTAYLAVAHPYFCLRVMEQATAITDDFQDEFFEALLANSASIFYAELKNNHNLTGGHRLHVPEENRLISFYLRDVSVAAKLGVYRSLGEVTLSRLDSDDALASHLNGAMRTYQDVGKYRCPIFCSIHFFRIMALEGLYQRIPDHLWLHYITHFTDHILVRARPLLPEDEHQEFATPFCYLLYELVDACTDWIEEAIHVTSVEDVLDKEQVEGRHIYIAFQATKALGGVMQTILLSDKITDSLKDELLSVVLRSLGRIEKLPQLKPLVCAVVSSLVRPHGFKARGGYLIALDESYNRQDRFLLAEVQKLGAVIANELA